MGRPKTRGYRQILGDKKKKVLARNRKVRIVEQGRYWKTFMEGENIW
jgi:hypothetical protein